MVNLEENYHFSKFQRGSIIFEGGPTFSRGGGSSCLFPIESSHITCDFPGGGGGGGGRLHLMLYNIFLN